MVLPLLDNQRHMSAGGFSLNLSIEVYGHLTILVKLLMSFGVITIPHLHSHPLLLLIPMLSMGILKGEEELHQLSQNRLCLGTLAKKDNCIFFQCNRETGSMHMIAHDLVNLR